MDIDLVDPQLRRALKKVPRLDFSNRCVRWLGRRAPFAIPEPAAPGVQRRWVSNGRLRHRLYQPDRDQPGPGILWFHGGGLVLGTTVNDFNLCTSTAAVLGVTVVSADYRLAPEHPFPAAIDDALDTWDWIQTDGPTIGVDPERVVVAGESGGGGLAACLVQRLRDSRAVQPIAQWLFGPMLDDRTTTRYELDPIDHFVCNNQTARYAWTAYLGTPPGQDHLPAYSSAARRSNLTGLPPTWLYAGDIELFHDEIANYAAALKHSGVPVDFVTVPGAPHGFEIWASHCDLAQQLVRSAQRWISSRLTPEGLDGL